MGDPTYPWALRLELEGFQSLRLERPGRFLRFDPIGEIAADDIVILTWNEHERLAATARAIRGGKRLTVVAVPEILTWLAGHGSFDGHEAPVEIDGVRIELMPYQPIPYAEGAEIPLKVLSSLVNPARAARRLLQRRKLPSAAPVVAQLTFPDGRRLLHLNFALQSHTPEPWLAEAVARFREPDWLITGVDYGYEASFLERIPRFGAKRLLVADLLSDTRRAIGMPTGVLTPLVDRLVEQGLEAYVFATHASFRFE